MANSILIQQLTNISEKKSVTDSKGKDWHVERNASGFVFTCLNSSRKVRAHLDLSSAILQITDRTRTPFAIEGKNMVKVTLAKDTTMSQVFAIIDNCAKSLSKS